MIVWQNAAIATWCIHIAMFYRVELSSDSNELGIVALAGSECCSSKTSLVALAADPRIKIANRSA